MEDRSNWQASKRLQAIRQELLQKQEQVDRQPAEETKSITVDTNGENIPPQQQQVITLPQ